MAVTEIFSNLSREELQEFVAKLIKTINSEHIFTDKVELKLDTHYDIEASDFDGNLYIPVTHEDTIDIERDANWICYNEEDRFDADDPEFENSIEEDAEDFFKTLSTTIEGYRVDLEVNDVDEDATVSVDVSSCSEEDGGIGEYEYWGHIEYDSQPYYAVEGVITQACTCYMTLIIEPLPETAE
jgi:hypothetical protein